MTEVKIQVVYYGFIFLVLNVKSSEILIPQEVRNNSFLENFATVLNE